LTSIVRAPDAPAAFPQPALFTEPPSFPPSPPLDVGEVPPEGEPPEAPLEEALPPASTVGAGATELGVQPDAKERTRVVFALNAARRKGPMA
jgi:hypothetical protein